MISPAFLSWLRSIGALPLLINFKKFHQDDAVAANVIQTLINNVQGSHPNYHQDLDYRTGTSIWEQQQFTVELLETLQLLVEFIRVRKPHTKIGPLAYSQIQPHVNSSHVLTAVLDLVPVASACMGVKCAYRLARTFSPFHPNAVLAMKLMIDDWTKYNSETLTEHTQGVPLHRSAPFAVVPYRSKSIGCLVNHLRQLVVLLHRVDRDMDNKVVACRLGRYMPLWVIEALLVLLPTTQHPVLVSYTPCDPDRMLLGYHGDVEHSKVRKQLKLLGHFVKHVYEDYKLRTRSMSSQNSFSAVLQNVLDVVQHPSLGDVHEMKISDGAFTQEPISAPSSSMPAGYLPPAMRQADAARKQCCLYWGGAAVATATAMIQPLCPSAVLSGPPFLLSSARLTKTPLMMCMDSALHDVTYRDLLACAVQQGAMVFHMLYGQWWKVLEQQGRLNMWSHAHKPMSQFNPDQINCKMVETLKRIGKDTCMTELLPTYSIPQVVPVFLDWLATYKQLVHHIPNGSQEVFLVLYMSQDHNDSTECQAAHEWDDCRTLVQKMKSCYELKSGEGFTFSLGDLYASCTEIEQKIIVTWILRQSRLRAQENIRIVNDCHSAYERFARDSNVEAGDSLYNCKVGTWAEFMARLPSSTRRDAIPWNVMSFTKSGDTPWTTHVGDHQIVNDVTGLVVNVFSMLLFINDSPHMQTYLDLVCDAVGRSNDRQAVYKTLMDNVDAVFKRLDTVRNLVDTGVVPPCAPDTLHNKQLEQSQAILIVEGANKFTRGRISVDKYKDNHSSWRRQARGYDTKPGSGSSSANKQNWRARNSP